MSVFTGFPILATIIWNCKDSNKTWKFRKFSKPWNHSTHSSKVDQVWLFFCNLDKIPWTFLTLHPLQAHLSTNPHLSFRPKPRYHFSLKDFPGLPNQPGCPYYVNAEYTVLIFLTALAKLWANNIDFFWRDGCFVFLNELFDTDRMCCCGDGDVDCVSIF